MYRSRWLTVATFAGVLAFGAASATQCTLYNPAPSPLPQGQLSVFPATGAAGAMVSVQGSGCSSVVGYIPVFLATTEAPSTRLSEIDGTPEMGAPGNWSVQLTIPQSVAPGSDYLIEAQCWGDGYNQGHPGMVVEYFAYDSHPFTVDAAP